MKPEASPAGGGGHRRKPPSTDDGKDREQPAEIVLPNIVEVTEESWATHKFDRFTALKIKDAGDGEHNGVDKQTVSQYDFFINVDNLYLKIEMKSAKSDASLLKARFMYGMVLVGLGLLQQDVAAQSKKTKRPEADEDEDGAGSVGTPVADDEDGSENVEERVERVTSALAPVLLPMIESLGAIDMSEVEPDTASGEST